MDIGRSVSTQIAAHSALKTGVHAVSTAYIAKTSQSAQTLSDTEIPAAIARDAEVVIEVAAEATARDAAIAAALATLTRLESKIITATRDVTAGSGDVSYTGVEFSPTVIIALGGFYTTPEARASIGFSDSSIAERVLANLSTDVFYNAPGDCLYFADAVGNYQAAVVKTYDADGFTLTCTKSGNPGAGTAKLNFLCLR